MKMLSELEGAIADNKARAMRYGAQLMGHDQQSAFTKKAAPNTGAAWAPRKRDAWWPMMIKSGRLRRLVTSGYGIKRKRAGARPALFGKLRSDARDDIIKANALNYGRKTFKPLMARPFLGISRSSRRRFRVYYERQIKKAID
jgi:phage gpG-like protein